MRARLAPPVPTRPCDMAKSQRRKGHAPKSRFRAACRRSSSRGRLSHARKRSSSCGRSGCARKCSHPSRIVTSSSPCRGCCGESSGRDGSCCSTFRCAMSPPRTVDAMGAIVTRMRRSMIESRVSATTGHCLSGCGNRNRRTSSRAILPATPPTRPNWWASRSCRCSSRQRGCGSRAPRHAGTTRPGLRPRPRHAAKRKTAASRSSARPAPQPARRLFSTNSTLAGRSARRRMYQANQASP